MADVVRYLWKKELASRNTVPDLYRKINSRIRDIEKTMQANDKDYRILQSSEKFEDIPLKITISHPYQKEESIQREFEIACLKNIIS